MKNANNTLPFLFRSLAYKLLQRSLAILVVCCFPLSGHTQQATQAKASVDTLAIKIGAPLTYQLKVKAPITSTIKWPNFQDSIGGFEVLKKQKLDTAVKGELQTYTQKIKLTSFEQGRAQIPALSIPYQLSSGNSDSLKTDSFSVRVTTVKLDSGNRIKPIKGLLDIPLTFRELLPYILGGIGVLLLIGIGYWLYKRWKRKKQLPVSTAEPLQLPHEKALKQLQQLEDERLWQKGYIKEYHDQLTDIIRDYLEHLLHINALELTTSEIMKELQGRALSKEQKEQLQQLFNTADMAKFAKAQPSSEENEQALAVAYAFIHETRGPVKTDEENSDQKS